jgi:uncharacterized protein YhbP (UPF0306 family)
MTDASASLPLRLILTQKTLVLATADPDPWSAPVYYVYHGLRFYFFSAADSRHVAAALASERCAASIFRDSDDWREIEGLQMDGRLERIPLGTEALNAFGAYLTKFPTVKDFFASAFLDFSQFTQRFRTQLFAFVPQRVFYLNNQSGLGQRREIPLSHLAP